MPYSYHINTLTPCDKSSCEHIAKELTHHGYITDVIVLENHTNSSTLKVTTNFEVKSARVPSHKALWQSLKGAKLLAYRVNRILQERARATSLKLTFATSTLTTANRAISRLKNKLNKLGINTLNEPEYRTIQYTPEVKTEITLSFNTKKLRLYLIKNSLEVPHLTKRLTDFLEQPHKPGSELVPEHKESHYSSSFT